VVRPGYLHLISEELHFAPRAGKAIAPSGADLVLTEVFRAHDSTLIGWP
jgi:hypothetical protein